MAREFKKWCDNLGFFQKKSEISHTLMNGGTLYVPINKHTIFYNKYSELIVKEEISLVERKTSPLFRLALDLDIIDEEAWSIERILDLASFIQSIIYDFYKENFNCILCSSEEHSTQGDHVKTGVHLHWPKLITNIENTELLYCTIVKKCEQEYGERPDYNTWGKLIDACVTKNIGLRTIGAPKYINGKNIGRKYWPISVINSKGEERPIHLNKLKKNLECAIKETSIRVWQNEPLKDIKNIPEYAENFEIKRQFKKKTTKSGYCGVWKRSSEDIISDYVYKSLPKEYKNCRIIDILTDEKEQTYLIHLTSSMSGNMYCTYCQNVKRNHSKNHIYWILNKYGFYQKCHSESSNKEKVPCSDYSSDTIALTRKVEEFIFSKNTNKLSAANNLIL